ncbi:helix-turn-helix transcriptional regulator [Saccharopolyspora shandongensis]|uniref:helix-turn-helix domain-containing protein n=1 Tax=Saccharopolyspora shandongensis TaxID=418495 RepID=UPI0033F3B61F
MARQGKYKPLPADGDPKTNDFKQRLRDAIQDADLTGAEVAREGNVTASRISEAINGYEVPSELAVRAITKACKLEPRPWLDARGELEQYVKDKERTGWSALPLQSGLHPLLRDFLVRLRDELSRTKLTPDDLKQRSGYSEAVIVDSLVGTSALKGYVVLSIARAAGLDAMEWHGQYRRALEQAEDRTSENWPPANFSGAPRLRRFGPAREEDIGMPAGMILNEWDVHTWVFKALPGKSASLDLAVQVAWWRLVELVDYVVRMLGAWPDPPMIRAMAESMAKSLRANIYAEHMSRKLKGQTPAAMIFPLSAPQFTGLQEWRQLAEQLHELQDLGEKTLECLVHAIHPDLGAEQAEAYLEKVRSTVDFMRILLEATTEAHGELTAGPRMVDFESKDRTISVDELERELAKVQEKALARVKTRTTGPWSWFRSRRS